MVLKKRFSYQWRVFLPILFCLWAVIIGMFVWHVTGIQDVRDEMAYDQLDVIGNRLVGYYEDGDTANIAKFSRFANRFYDESDNYDPLSVWVMDADSHTIIENYGTPVSPDFSLPPGRQGKVDIPGRYLDDGNGRDSRYIYSAFVTPDKDKIVYVMLPYTKRLQATISSRTTYILLICVAIGIFASIVIYMSIAYYTRNLKTLRTFVLKASTSPIFSPPKDMKFPNNEMGDITRQVIAIYNQRMDEMAKSDREHKVALNAIEDKNRMKRELTGNINHELKTPIGVIKGYIDTLVSDPAMPAETRDRFLAKAQLSVNRLTDLVQDITAITKLESGGKLVNIQEINFHDLAFAFENYLKEGNVLQGKMKFAYDIPLNCHVKGNEALLTTVLLNLVKNSVAYSEGTECHLLHVREDDKFHYFKYFDNGIGVPPEHLPHMFERFYRVNAGRSRNTGGTGLGLSIVEVTIESFGGKIEVLNHFPTGLEYNFSLPKPRKSPGSQPLRNFTSSPDN